MQSWNAAVKQRSNRLALGFRLPCTWRRAPLPEITVGIAQPSSTVWAFPSAFLAYLHYSFLPRDAMRKRGLCCRPVSVRPSVSLSVTLVYCIQTAKDIVKRLCRSGSAIILDFGSRAPLPNSKRGRKVHGKWKICDLPLKSPFISETVWDRPLVAMGR